ncbi:dephospho-CoA kinase [Lysinibacter cavernae]|uniref:Dephospho-CoA kinase n=1 Tax=Lysinibacter cavernae TaxID=1640652 RepID=A0A7X5QZP5_9MICO|nr:dephospho-CoA kinase [Lysinibacter cavernae]
MYLIGLTGGIAAGKSTVSRRLAEHGAHHIDADQLAREAVASGSKGLTSVAQAFGQEVITPDGNLDRAALGAIVFHDPAKLEVLNGIVHPEVQRLTRERFASITEGEPDAVIVYDVPLLVEAKVNHPWDLIVTVEAPVETRVRRLIELRGMTEDEARGRISKQATSEQRQEVADVVIDSSGSVDETIAQTDALWQRVINRL